MRLTFDALEWSTNSASAPIIITQVEFRVPYESLLIGLVIVHSYVMTYPASQLLDAELFAAPAVAEYALNRGVCCPTVKLVLVKLAIGPYPQFSGLFGVWINQ